MSCKRIGTPSFKKIRDVMGTRLAPRPVGFEITDPITSIPLTCMDCYLAHGHNLSLTKTMQVTTVELDQQFLAHLYLASEYRVSTMKKDQLALSPLPFIHLGQFRPSPLISARSNTNKGPLRSDFNTRPEAQRRL
jgi:hypothetical protein